MSIARRVTRDNPEEATAGARPPGCDTVVGGLESAALIDAPVETRQLSRMHSPALHRARWFMQGCTKQLTIVPLHWDSGAVFELAWHAQPPQ